MAKLYATEAAQRIIDGCVQLHGARGAAARPPARTPLPRRAVAAHLRGRVGDPALDHRPRSVHRQGIRSMSSDYRFRASAPLTARLAALPVQQGRRRRDGHPGSSREAEPADLRELRRPARPARRAAAPPGRARAGHPRRGQGILRRRRRQRDHRRADQDGAARPHAVHQDDRRRHPGDARVPDPDHHRDPRHRGRRRRGRRARLRLPGGQHVGPVRVPVHQGRAVRRRHGRGLPAAARGRARAGPPTC